MRRPALPLPTDWTPQQALAAFEFLDALRDRVWELYGPQIQQAMREDRGAAGTTPSNSFLDQSELPY